MGDFKPSEVHLDVFPLMGTYNRVEREYAAAMLVHVCALKGDRWQPITLAMIEEVVSDIIRHERAPMIHWIRNPFARPAYDELAQRGFAQWVMLEDGSRGLELTAVGLEALLKHVRKAA